MRLDPDFALARARLALVYVNVPAGPLFETRLELARQEATAALRTKPDLADAHFVLGVYWVRRHDHERALVEYAKARKEGYTGHSGGIYASMGASYLGLGRWEEAVEALERALEADPQKVRYAPQLAMTYGRLRRYKESTRTWDRYIALTPDAYNWMLVKGYVFVRWQGTADTLAAVLRRVPADWDDNGMATYARVTVARLQRRPEDALAALAASRNAVSDDGMLYQPHSLLRALAYDDARDSIRARVHYDSARAMLRDSVAAHPNEPRLHIALGMALAGLGRKDEAIRAARQAMALAPLSSDVSRATAFMGGAAEIFALLGENDAALQLLEQLLQMPAGREASVPLLRVDPTFDRLRDDPRFQRMLERHATS